MKIFVSGSKAFNAGLLPESVCTCLDELMTDGNEILIGDCPGMDIRALADFRGEESFGQ